MSEEKIQYTKLGNLVDDEFTVTKAGGYLWKKYDPETKRFLVEESYKEGFSKKYTIDTDKGRMDLGPGQLSSLLEATYYQGKADINGKTFKVKSNGKTGMDIRYFFNLKRETAPKPMPVAKPIEDNLPDDDYDGNRVDIESIPF
jgi:hypothetical protein